MADSKVSNLTDIGAITTDDLIYVINDPGGTPSSRKATVSEFITLLHTQRSITGWDAEIVAQSDQDVSSNTTPQVDNELRFDMTAGAVYIFEAYIAYSSPVGGGTPDFKEQWNGPATLTGSYLLDASYLNTVDAQGAAQPGVALGSSGSIGTATTPRVASYSGWAHSTSGGTGASGFRFEFAQVNSGANAVRRLAGSFLRYRKLAV